MWQRRAISNSDLDQLFCVLWRLRSRRRFEYPVTLLLLLSLLLSLALALTLSLSLSLSLLLSLALALSLSLSLLLSLLLFAASWWLLAALGVLLATSGRSWAAPVGSWALLGSSWRLLAALGLLPAAGCCAHCFVTVKDGLHVGRYSLQRFETGSNWKARGLSEIRIKTSRKLRIVFESSWYLCMYYMGIGPNMLQHASTMANIYICNYISLLFLWFL